MRFQTDVKEALHTIDQATDALENGKLAKDHNYSTAYFNRACYRMISLGANTSPTTIDDAIKDLEIYLQNIENPKAEIDSAFDNDADLADLLKTEAFKKFVKTYQYEIAVRPGLSRFIISSPTRRMSRMQDQIQSASR